MRAGRAQDRREGRKRASKAAEDGFSLVEVLLALTIVSMVVIVGVGGMATLALSSGQNRAQGATGSVVRRAAEAVAGDAYIPCPQVAAAPVYSLGMPVSANLLPENAVANRVQLPFIVKITTFDGSTTIWTPGPGWNCGAVGSTALQVVWLEDDAATQTAGAPGGPPVWRVTQSMRVVKSP